MEYAASCCLIPGRSRLSHGAVATVHSTYMYQRPSCLGLPADRGALADVQAAVRCFGRRKKSMTANCEQGWYCTRCTRCTRCSSTRNTSPTGNAPLPVWLIARSPRLEALEAKGYVVIGSLAVGLPLTHSAQRPTVCTQSAIVSTSHAVNMSPSQLVA